MTTPSSLTFCSSASTSKPPKLYIKTRNFYLVSGSISEQVRYTFICNLEVNNLDLQMINTTLHYTNDNIVQDILANPQTSH